MNEKIARFKKHQDLASPEMKIIAGGGIDIESIVEIRRATNIREFHVGRAARESNRIDGKVRVELVSELVRKINEL